MEHHYYNKSDKKVEELARIFASKLPKETNFNNRKSNKYFQKDESERTTIKDNLLYNIQDNPFESISKAYLIQPTDAATRKYSK